MPMPLLPPLAAGLLCAAVAGANAPEAGAAFESMPLGLARAEPPSVDDLIARASDGFHFTPGPRTEPAHDAAQNASTLATSLAHVTIATQSQTAPTTQPADADALQLPPRTSSNPYFTPGSWRWQLTGSIASDFHDVSHVMAGFGWSYFLERDLTVDFEVNGLFISQEEGSDTAALNLAMLLRWHFKIDDAQRWSIYADAGVGLLSAGSDVPGQGSSVNFTPQLGIGASFLIDEASDARLLTGLRWHHISNANTFEDNYGVDALMLYAGVNFPF